MHKKPDEWPKEVKRGSVTVKIYRTVNRGRTMFTLAYHDGGGRKLRQFGDLADARREAKETADTLNAGQGAALELTGADRDAYRVAVRELKPLGVPLNVAVSEYVRAMKFNVPIVEAAKVYAESNRAKLPDRTVTEVYDEMLLAKKADGASRVNLVNLKYCLAPFARDFQMPVASVATEDIDAWLRALKLSPRTRNNHRNAIVNLFNFAKSAGYLSRDRSTVADHTALARKSVEAIEIFSAAEFSKLLAAADESVLPFFVLGGFCGLRTAEIQRLRWEDVRWGEGSIVISSSIAKTRTRRLAPLTPSAVAWLSGSENKKGKVLKVDKLYKKTGAICKSSGVKWKDNGLRHSFITFRVASTKDFVKTAYEAGNSPQVIRSNYDAVASEDEGKLWFSIMPETAANVVQIGALA